MVTRKATLRETASDRLSREKDRRQLNVPVKSDRRTGTRERRRCPECDSPLEQVVRKLADGSVTASTCPKCGWSKSSRQTDGDVMLLKLAWSLELAPHSGQLAVVLPQELAEALKAKAGDEWVLEPLVKPLGSLPMKWSLSIKKAKRGDLSR